jgi:hypothetical protein
VKGLPLTSERLYLYDVKICLRRKKQQEREEADDEPDLMVLASPVELVLVDIVSPRGASNLGYFISLAHVPLPSSGRTVLGEVTYCYGRTYPRKQGSE